MPQARRSRNHPGEEWDERGEREAKGASMDSETASMDSTAARRRLTVLLTVWAKTEEWRRV